MFLIDRDVVMRFSLTQLMRQEAGIQRRVETINTAPTKLSLSIAKTRLMLSSSTISQNRSTIS